MKKLQLFKIILAIPTCLVAMWVCGLLYFIHLIPTNIKDTATKTDTIIILTGGSARLNEGFDLLKSGKSDVMFISGVGSGVKVAELVPKDLPDNFKNKIVLGYEASDTKGNALESFKWVKNNNYKSIRLVTANYHMPRSLVEFKNAMPGVLIIEHPVSPENIIIDSWWKNKGTRNFLIAEYNKYLFSHTRDLTHIVRQVSRITKYLT